MAGRCASGAGHAGGTCRTALPSPRPEGQYGTAALLLAPEAEADEAIPWSVQAKTARWTGSGASIWSFSPGRQALFSLSVALHTGDAAGALRAASVAEASWNSGTPKALATWAQVRAGAAMADLMPDSLDGAAAQIAPVLELAPEMRIGTVTGYLRTLDQMLFRPTPRGQRPSSRAPAADQRLPFCSRGLLVLPEQFTDRRQPRPRAPDLRWLHATVLLVGRAADLAQSDLDQMLGEARLKLNGTVPQTVTLGPVIYHAEGIVLPMSPASALAPIFEAAGPPPSKSPGIPASPVPPAHPGFPT
jgi:hypothetical protein